MKKRIIMFSAVSAAIVVNATTFARVRGGSFTTPVSSRAGSPTTPVSSYRSGLVPSRSDSFGRDQNLVVTGNVPGGRHFRGVVPYSSVNSLGVATDVGAASTVESFIRRSSGLPYIDSDPSLVQPYYLPRQTLTSVARGNVSGLVPPRIQFPGGTGRFAVPRAKPLEPADTSSIYRPRSMLSMSTIELERLSGRDLLLSTFGGETDGLLRNSIRAGLPEEKEAAVRPAPREDALLKGTVDEPATPEGPLEPTVALTASTKELAELLEKDLQARLEARAETVKQDRAEERDRAEEAAEEATEAAEATEGRLAKAQTRYEMKLPEKRRLPEADHERALAILGEHKTYASLAQARFDEFMKSGNAFMKEGRYYKAVNAYVLATVWNSRDGQVNLYRGIAHFAAGEYISGSLFVHRAILLAPEIAGEKTELTSILPDKDLIDNRLIEAVDWQKRSDSGEIALLLAYIYRQQDRLDEARQFITIAQDKLPESKAVEVLKAAIDTAK